MAKAVTKTFLFSSEHVSEGHPDKMADQVSDAVLDACLKDDPNSKVACETATKTGMVMVFGEITTESRVDYQKTIRDAVKDIGFDDGKKGFDYYSCSVLNALEQQSPDIAQATLYSANEELGAGDQGLMFGYATTETETLMPLSYEYARELAVGLRALRDPKNANHLAWLRPDCKTQVTVQYEHTTNSDGSTKLVPQFVHTVLVSCQHSPDVTNEQIDKDIKAFILRVIDAKHIKPETVYHINPSKLFVIGGPHGDAGLTGRKIIVDTYGGWGAHGGGAFSGKDPTKVDRSASYAARWVAKSLVAAGLADRCLVQLAYAIGVAEPLSIHVDSYGTVTKKGKDDANLLRIVKENFSLTPFQIIKQLDLRKPIYFRTARFGHFGRKPEADGGFSWEKPKALKL